MKVLCVLLLSCLAAHAAAQGTFESPGMDFSLIIPGWNYATFGPTQRATLCNYITNSWQALSQGGVPYCNVLTVGNWNGTSVVASGNAYFTWPNGTPNVVQINAASSVRDATVLQLTTNTNTVVGTVFPGTIANCACNGLDMVYTSNTQPYSYNSVVTGIPGPMVCGARLTYNSYDQNAVYNQVGVDDGSTSNNANFGKYCSNPAVAGGVQGTPGQGSCRTYGVTTSGTNGNECIVGPQGIGMGSGATRGSVVAVTPTYPGSGFTTTPTVTVSAPDPLPAQAVFSLNSNAQPTGLDSSTSTTILTPSNGPYVGDYLIASSLTEVCVDTGSVPPAAFDPNSAICTGPQKTIQVVRGGVPVAVTGYTCTANDFNTVVNGPPLTGKCGSSGIPGGKRPCGGVSDAGVLNYVGFPGSANVYCAGIPSITFTTASLQVASRAVVTAQVVGGSVVGLPVISGGSGYRTPARVTVAPPASNGYGKLCSPNPILGLPASIADPAAYSMSMTGVCQPFGRDTQTNKPCSEPAVPNGGEWIALDSFTCNVQSSFLSQPGSNNPKSCGILPQTFVLSNTPAPPPPPAQSPPTPSPSPDPSPSPTPSPSPRPSPSPAPTVRCTYDGVYRIESAQCSGNYLSYVIGSKSCNNDTVLLRTSNQAKPPRINWRLDATALANKTPSASVVSAVGRLDSCKNTNLLNLAATTGDDTPQLAGQGWKVRIIPSNIKNSCNVIRIQAATGNNNNGRYLATTKCGGGGNNFAWKPLNTNDNTMQWKLKYISD